MDAWSWAAVAALICLMLLIVVLVSNAHRRRTPGGRSVPRNVCPAVEPEPWLWRFLRWLWRLLTSGTFSAKPSHTTDAMYWLWQQLYALEPSTLLGGTYASKPGYHNYRNGLPPYDYSVCDQPPDGGGPGDMCGAIDWTFPDAQSGDYRRIAKYTRRLMDSARDLNDPRLNGWREFYGNLDDGGNVDGYDMRYGTYATSDSSHYWHIHLSENRDQSTSYDNKRALLSVLRGESVEQWLGGTIGDGAVILNCPYDKDRLDILYVAPDGDVVHNWYGSGGMNALWTGSGSSETLGGAIVPGTLSAAWDPQGTLMNIIGLGAPDDANAPAGAGQYWGYTLKKGGGKSGWGSLSGVYGQLPATSGGGMLLDLRSRSEWRKPQVWILLASLLLMATAVTMLALR